MSIWSTLGSIASSVGSAGLNLIERGLDRVGGGEENRRSVAFTVAVVALAAKMAKADGIVTPEEMESFWTHFEVAPRERRNVTRMFRLAQQDVAGFESYAERIARLYPDEPEVLEHIVDVLFTIAAADGYLHEDEETFLERVADIFELDPMVFGRIRSRYVAGDGPDGPDPYAVLGVDPSASDAELRRRYLQLVSEHHPDRMLAHDVPPEFVKIANDRLAEINVAWETISQWRRVGRG